MEIKSKMAERITAQKMKFSIKNLFCKCEETLNGRNLLKKSLMENFIFCAVNLYFHPKSFKSIFKLNSYLVSISRHGPVTPSIPFFPITISQKQLKIYLLFHNQWKIAAMISIFNLLALIWFTNRFLIWRHFPVVVQ